MNAHAEIKQLSKMLKNLDRWIEDAATFAKTRNFDPEVYVQLRLYPDMFPLVKQVQAACDAAKFAAAYLTGQKPPVHPDTETTLAQIRERIATCAAYLDGLTEADFAGAAERRVSPPWLGGAWLTAEDYMREAAVPNFHFHVVTAYDILRHAGVQLGKVSFIGALPVKQG
jgi:hypothetical protein